MRGLAILMMIQCHAFNSWARFDVREGGTYVLTQFVGGMAAPLFLFMAGMTLAFYMERQGSNWYGAVRRGAYVLGIAFLFRLVNGAPKFEWREMSKVDILNCMGVAMMAYSLVALCDPRWRVHVAAGGALAVAVTAPWVANLDWTGVPVLLHDYIAPVAGSGRFAFFPNAAYVGFGLAAGTLVRRSAEETFDRLMQWMVLIGFALIFSGQYFANLPYSIYTSSEFWTNSPALVWMRFGISLLLMAAAHLWTQYGTLGGWSWMQCLGRSSLLVYWVHIMFVYGDSTKRIHAGLGIGQAAAATAVVIAAMVGLSAGWQWWQARRRVRRHSAVIATDSTIAAS
jgi:hypothetical protein